MKPGEYLKLKRNEKKLSLRQLALKTGLSHTYISDIEKGNLIGTNETHEKIIESLNFNEVERNHYYTLLFDNENLPKYINDKLKFLEIENKELKKKLKDCENKLKSKDEQSGFDREIYKSILNLTEKQKEKILKFIDEYIK